MHLQNSREILALADSSGFAVFSPPQAAAGELLPRHLHLQFNQAAGEYCGVKLSGNVSVGPVGSGSWDLCFALFALPLLHIPPCVCPGELSIRAEHGCARARGRFDKRS